LEQGYQTSRYPGGSSFSSNLSLLMESIDC